MIDEYHFFYKCFDSFTSFNFIHEWENQLATTQKTILKQKYSVCDTIVCHQMIIEIVRNQVENNDNPIKWSQKAHTHKRTNRFHIECKLFKIHWNSSMDDEKVPFQFRSLESIYHSLARSLALSASFFLPLNLDTRFSFVSQHTFFLYVRAPMQKLKPYALFLTLLFVRFDYKSTKHSIWALLKLCVLFGVVFVLLLLLFRSFFSLDVFSVDV